MELLQETELAVKTEVNLGTKIIGGIIVGLGAALLSGYVMAGFLASENGFARETSAQKNDANAVQTTCGTYTSPDGGQNLPFVASGKVDKDCTTKTTGNDVCDHGVRPYCIMAEPTPPQATIAFQGNSADVTFAWTTDVLTNDNCVLYVPATDSQGRDNAECIWGQNLPHCAGQLNVFCAGDFATAHSIDKILPLQQKYYFAISSEQYGQGTPQLRSEIRWFDTNLTAGS